MKAPSLDKPFRFTLDFWIAFTVLAVPTLWLSRPWSWDLPIVSKVSGLVFLPIAAVIVCYCPVLFAMALLRGGREERKVASAWVGAVAGAVVFLGLVWSIYGFDGLPSFIAIPAVLIANFIYTVAAPKPGPHKARPPSVTDRAGARSGVGGGVAPR